MTLDISHLLTELTVDEKISLLDGQDFWHTQALPAHGVPSIMVTDGPHGLRKQSHGSDHLGINASDPATCFPPAAGLASSWNPDVLREVGVALGEESQAQQVSVLLGPGINMKRSPLCGRNFEYFSEDPLLAGALGAGLVNGVQSQGVGTSLKHLVANNQETDRMSIDTLIDERTLREIYLPAFERVVKEEQPWTVMCSYNRLNGEFVSESRRVLTEILREEWGFEGLVVSDWGAVNERDAAVHAGLDLEMPSSNGFGAAVVREAYDAGKLTDEDIDTCARRVLELVSRATDNARTDAQFDIADHHEVARNAAEQSLVLLKNEDVLPLDPTGDGTIAVIGEFARSPRYQGAGSSQVNPTRVTNALDSIRELAGQQRVAFAPGYETTADESDPALLSEAVDLAREACVAIVFVGLPGHYESEGFDREHMNMPASHIELIREVAQANPSTVVVLSNGSAVELASWRDDVPAILEGWLLGQAGGEATARILFGAANPSGRLAETLPLALEHNPSFGSFPGEHGVTRYGEGLLIGYRWYDAHGLEVAYPFGFGLSYTSFSYSDFSVTPGTPGESTAEVRLTVTNTGRVAGADVVQIYVHDPVSSVHRPEHELRGFARVELEPRESREVTIRLNSRAFAFWHDQLREWIVEGGEFEIRVGSSSRDIVFSERITFEGDDVVEPVNLESTVDELLEHPVMGPWLREQVAGTDYEQVLFDEVNGRMMRAIPLVRISRFGGFPVDISTVRDKLAEIDNG